jgi:outer membrane receptor for ferrienterochelin and colicins
MTNMRTLSRDVGRGALAVCAALALCATSGRAHAQHAPHARDHAEQVVITGTRTPESAQRATVKTDVVTREEAERRGATNVADALSSQPGVQVNPGAYGFLGGVSAIQIQGFDLQRVLVLEDGEPVIGDVGGAIDLANLPIQDVQRIEVVMGPTSSLYGSSAIGGVVNVITAPPSTFGWAGRLRLEGRSHRGLVWQSGLSYRSARAWLTLDSNLTRQDGIARTLPLPDLQIPEQLRGMVGLRGGLALSDRADLRVRARVLRDETEGLTSREAPGFGRYLLDMPARTDRYTLHVIQTVRSSGGTNLRMTLGQQWVDNESARLQRGSEVGEVRARSQVMQSAEAVVTIPHGPRTWVFGARAQIDRYGQTLEKRESLTGGIATRAGDEVTRQNIIAAAPYGQLSWKFGEHLTVMPGLRAEVNSQFGSAVTPRLALASRWLNERGSGFTARLSGGRGFRTPSAKELGFAFDHSVFGYRVIGSDDLRPETSWGLNADVSYQVGGTTPTSDTWRVRAGGFSNWVDDLIDLDVASGASTGGVVDYTYKNFGRARTVGGQVDVMAQWGERLRGELSYDYLWTRDELNERPLAGRPPHTVTASVRALPFAPISSLELYARFRALASAFVSPDVRSPGSTQLDLRVSIPLRREAQAFVGALNVFDVRQDPGRVGDLRNPLGRVIYFGLRASFSEDP